MGGGRGEDDDPSIHCLVRQSSARATDGRMEDDEDDDPFDDPVGETFLASSERLTSDCADEDADKVCQAETSMAPAKVRKVF